MTLPDPMGRILTETRDDAGVAAITTRIRGGEPMGKTATDEGDARGAGNYIPFVVFTRLGVIRLPHCPTQEVRISARCYGVTFQQAAQLAGAVSDALHARGLRISPTGIVIFSSLDDGGGGATKDPDTGQPYESVIFSVGALTETLPI
jgi:hypothetical protein